MRRPGMPDATAHRPRPQSPDGSTALPRWWHVVTTKNSLISLALPPLEGHCLPWGRSLSRGRGVTPMARERPFFYFALEQTPARLRHFNREPHSCLVAGRDQTWPASITDSSGVFDIAHPVNLRLKRLVKTILCKFIAHSDDPEASSSWGPILCGLLVPGLGLDQAWITRSCGS